MEYLLAIVNGDVNQCIPASAFVKPYTKPLGHWLWWLEAKIVMAGFLLCLQLFIGHRVGLLFE